MKISEIDQNKLQELISLAFSRLIQLDGTLFECQFGDRTESASRKLHEVCINHRLAMHLKDALFSDLDKEDQARFYVDIEFNRDGAEWKWLKIRKKWETPRPDIIVHNRKSGSEKENFLVIECKKSDSEQEDIKNDIRRLKEFIRSSRFEYKYGLQVIYDKNKLKGDLYFKNTSSEIESVPISIP